MVRTSIPPLHKRGQGEFVRRQGAFYGGLATVLSLLLLPAAALALTYSPPTFDLTADPGQTLSESLAVRNDTASPMTIDASSLNFAPKAGDETSGIPEFYPASEARDGRGAAKWISFSKTEVTLAPGERSSLDFKIEVPMDAEPGSHFGAVALRTQASAGGSGVGVVSENMTLVMLKVSGPSVENLRLASFDADTHWADSLPIGFTARFENAGSVHERPFGKITVKNMFGRVVATIPFNRADNKSVMPMAARRIETSWNGRNLPKGTSPLVREWYDFHFGPYTADLDVQWSSQDRTLHATAYFWVFPWLALLILIAGIAALTIGLVNFVHWYNRRLIKRYEREHEKK